MLEFTVLGVPVPQGSKVRGRWGGIHEDNPKLRPWREAMLFAIGEAMSDQHVYEPERGPVGLEVDFMMPRPRSHYGTGRNAGQLRESAPDKYHAQKPDTDKLIRALGDALKIAGAIGDDCQIARITARKMWSDSAYMAVWVEKLP